MVRRELATHRVDGSVKAFRVECKKMQSPGQRSSRGFATGQLHSHTLCLDFDGRHLNFGLRILGVDERLQQVDGLVLIGGQHLFATSHRIFAELREIYVRAEPPSNEQRKRKCHQEAEIDTNPDINRSRGDPLRNIDMLGRQRLELAAAHDIKCRQLQVMAIVHLDELAMEVQQPIPLGLDA